jgi:hypothetical protein
LSKGFPCPDFAAPRDRVIAAPDNAAFFVPPINEPGCHKLLNCNDLQLIWCVAGDAPNPSLAVAAPAT